MEIYYLVLKQLQTAAVLRTRQYSIICRVGPKLGHGAACRRMPLRTNKILKSNLPLLLNYSIRRLLIQVPLFPLWETIPTSDKSCDARGYFLFSTPTTSKGSRASEYSICNDQFVCYRTLFHSWLIVRLPSVFTQTL